MKELPNPNCPLCGGKGEVADPDGPLRRCPCTRTDPHGWNLNGMRADKAEARVEWLREELKALLGEVHGARANIAFDRLDRAEDRLHDACERAEAVLALDDQRARQ